MAIKKMNYAFKKGCGKVTKEEYPNLQSDLMSLLGIKTRQHYYTKRTVYPNMPAHVKSGIEEVFRKYGVDNPDDIWTITTIEV